MMQKSFNQNVLQDQKPVNINISFNINRKQVNQSYEQERSFSIKNQLGSNNVETIQKARNLSFKSSKTPELPQTDRNIYSKQLDYLRPTEQLKRRRKSKKGSGDYTAEKIVNYTANQMDKSLGHKRGFTTTVGKKPPTNKNKKNATKTDDSIRDNKKSVMMEYAKGQVKSSTIQKNLKTMINKLINSQLSKRSLPLPPSKSKYCVSTSLTSRKPTNRASAKKKPSNSNNKSMQKSVPRPISYTQPLLNKLNNLSVLEKLAQFKSFQNSYLISEEKEKPDDRTQKGKTIFIPTDQSLDCIGEIHSIEREMWKRGFFQINQQTHKTGDTQHLVNMYVKMLAQNNQDSQSHHQKLNNHLNQEDYMQVQQMFQSTNKKRSPSHLRQDHHTIEEIQHHDVHSETESDQNEQDDGSPINLDEISDISKKHQQNQQQTQQLIIPRKNNYLMSHQASGSKSQEINEKNEIIRPFISTQLQGEPKLSASQVQQVNLLKKQQIQKWGYLLHFIKSSMNNSQTNTQQVLQQVYHYLQKAKGQLQKVDLGKQRPIDQFTNRLDQSTNKHQSQQFFAPRNQQQYELYHNKQFQPQQSHLKNQKFMVGPDNDGQGQSEGEPESQLQEPISQALSFQKQYQQGSNMQQIPLSSIQSALQSRLSALHQRKQRDLLVLEQSQKSNIDEEKLKIQKHYQTLISEINQVRKNIFKGYNQAKGVLEKSFQEGTKQRTIMRCLSQDYLARSRSNHSNNYRKIINEQQSVNNKLVINSPNKQQTTFNQKVPKPKQTSVQREKIKKQAITQNNQRFIQKKSNKRQKSEQKESQKLQRFVQREVQIVNIEKDWEQNSSSSEGHSSQGPELSHPLSHSSQDELQKINHQLILMKQQHLQQIDPQNHVNQFSLDEEDKSDQDKFYQQDKSQSEKSNQQDKSFGDKSQDRSLNVNYQEHDAQISGDDQDYYDYDKEDRQYQTQQENHIIQHEINGLNKKNKQQPLADKLKYITAEDKQDIFEFLFLDLCIELYQEPCAQNRFMQSINKHIQKIYEQSRRKKGVKTNLNVVKDYMKRFCGYLLRTSRKSLDNLNVPMGPTAIEMLKYMHDNDDNEIQQQQEGEGLITLIVPIQAFDTFDRSLLSSIEFEKYYDEPQKQTQRINFLKNILHIHNKSLFDALNQYLDQHRPYGIWGKPFPWKRTSSFDHSYDEIQIQEKLQKSAEKVVQTCSYVCGLLVDKEQSLIGNSKVSEAYLEQIREDRISRMLANDMIQNQERWVFYDDQETEVLVEAAQTVYNRLVDEIAQEIATLEARTLPQR